MENFTYGSRLIFDVGTRWVTSWIANRDAIANSGRPEARIHPMLAGAQTCHEASRVSRHPRLAAKNRIPRCSIHINASMTSATIATSPRKTRAKTTRPKTGPRDDAGRNAAAKAVQQAEKRIRELAAICGETSERWSLRGSCQKRLAQILVPEERLAALELMASHYEAAGKAAKDAAFYPALMQAAARTLIALQTGKPPPADVTASTDRMAAGAEGDFWQEVNVVDAKVLQAVQAGRMPRELESDVHAAYRRAWRHGGSPLKLMSVLEQLVFLADVLSDGAELPKERQELVAALRRLYGLLEQELRQAR